MANDQGFVEITQRPRPVDPEKQLGIEVKHGTVDMNYVLVDGVPYFDLKSAQSAKEATEEIKTKV